MLNVTAISADHAARILEVSRSDQFPVLAAGPGANLYLRDRGLWLPVASFAPKSS